MKELNLTSEEKELANEIFNAIKFGIISKDDYEKHFKSKEKYLDYKRENIMKDLMVFENDKFGKIRTIEINNEPWFVAKDICNILELKNARVAVSRLDKDEVSKLNLRRFIGRNKYSK